MLSEESSGEEINREVYTLEREKIKETKNSEVYQNTL